MLIYRKPGEWIRIGDDIIIEVRRRANRTLALHVTAPKDVKVLQGEELQRQLDERLSRTLGEPEGLQSSRFHESPAFLMDCIRAIRTAEC